MDRHKSITFTKTIPKKSYPKKKIEDPKQEREKAIIKDYLAGMTLLRIEIEYTCDSVTIYKLLNKYGVKIRKKENIEDKIKHILKDGDLTVEEIAKKLGMNQQNLKSYMKRYNLNRYLCRCKQGFIYTLQKK